MKNTKIEILIVEDNKNDVEMTLRALKKKNLVNSIHVINDGAEALEFIFATGIYKDRDINQHPKIILLDLNLPKVNGLEILKKIKSNEQTKSIPVVILTSSNEETDIIESYKTGANSYIVKPVNFENFAKSVSEVGMYWLLLNKPPV